MQTTPEYHNLQVQGAIYEIANAFRKATTKLLVATTQAREASHIAYLRSLGTLHYAASQEADKIYTQPFRDTQALIDAAYLKFEALAEEAEAAGLEDTERLDMDAWVRRANQLMVHEIGLVAFDLTRGAWALGPVC